MIQRRTTVVVLAALAATALAIPFTLSESSAQQPGPGGQPQELGPPTRPAPPALHGGQQPGTGGPPPEFRPQIAPSRQGPGMMGGGQPVMLADGESLFVLIGHRLYKVKKSTMAVAGELELPLPRPREDAKGAPRDRNAPPPETP